MAIYNDKNGLPLEIGDRIEGQTNFHTVQGTVVYDPSGFTDYDHWFIDVDKHLENRRWENHHNYRLYLAYHVDENNNCIYYQKI